MPISDIEIKTGHHYVKRVPLKDLINYTLYFISVALMENLSASKMRLGLNSILQINQFLKTKRMYDVCLFYSNYMMTRLVS